MPSLDRSLNSRIRADDGCIITLREQATREMRVIHVRGSLHTRRGHKAEGTFTHALEDAVRRIRSMEGDWCVVTISTPSTILADIRNQGRDVSDGNKGDNRHSDRHGRFTPEEKLLNMVDALDLIELLPSYRMPDRRFRNKYRPEAVA